MAQDVGDQAMEELNTSLEEIRAAGPSYQQWLELTDRDIPEQTKIVESCLSNKESLKEQLEQVWLSYMQVAVYSANQVSLKTICARRITARRNCRFSLIRLQKLLRSDGKSGRSKAT